MAKTINDIAAELDVTPRALRKFIRANVKANGGTIGQDTPGKGKRYSYDARDAARLIREFRKANANSKNSESETASA